MKRIKIQDLKELPLSEVFIYSEKQKISEKIQKLTTPSIIRYLIPALSIALVMFILVTDIRKKKNINETQTYDNLYFYQFMDMFEYMDILENLTEEDLR